MKSGLSKAGRVGALLAAWVVACAPQAWAAVPAPPSAQDFAQPPSISNVSVSPSGRRMALLVPGPNGRVRLGVMELEPVGQPRVIAAFNDANIKKARWVNDGRLVFEAFQDSVEVSEWGAGTFAIDHDGKQQQQLIAWSHHTDNIGSQIASRILPYGWFLHSTIDDGSDDVFVQKQVKNNRGDVVEVQLSRLNTRTRVAQSLNAGIPDGTRSWVLDASDQPRVVSAQTQGERTVHWKNPADGKWQQVARFNAYTDEPNPAGPRFIPLAVDDQGQLLVQARVGGDVSALYRFDPVARRLDPQPLAKVDGFDLGSTLVIDRQTDKLLGLHVKLDRSTSVWFDDDMARLQRSIDTALPKDRVNRLLCGRCSTSPFFVVHSSSDRQPGEYYLFNRNKRSIELLGVKHPRVPEATQGQRSFHRVPARDGLSLPVVVTHPPGHEGPLSADKRALPTVVLVHGGPWVRGGSTDWDAEAQFLATRGWRVLEPEFRGSDGFGFRHFRAGWKQWGGAMQDDLVDALQWATQQGWVDAKRVCIMGASYGGYAALMAPIVHPTAFRCAASFVGVTDINLLYDSSWSDLSEEYKRYGMPVLVGDPNKDAAMLAAASPLLRAGELKVPVLVTHGGLDRRVPIDHSRKFVRAAREAGVAVESKEYLDEGHGFLNPANRADHWQLVEKFLRTHLEADRP